MTARAGSAHGVRALAAAGVNAKAVDQVRANNDAASDAVAASLARLATSQEAFETVDVQHKQAMASHKTAIDAAGLSLNNSKFAAAEDARDILDTAEATRSTVAQQAGLARNRSVALCAEQHQGRAAGDAARHASVEKLSKLVNQFRACSNNEKKVVEEKAEVKEESVAAEKAVEAQAATAVKAEAAEEKTDAFLQVRTNLRRARVSVRQCQEIGDSLMRFRSMVHGANNVTANVTAPKAVKFGATLTMTDPTPERKQAAAAALKSSVVKSLGLAASAVTVKVISGDDVAFLEAEPKATPNTDAMPQAVKFEITVVAKGAALSKVVQGVEKLGSAAGVTALVADMGAEVDGLVGATVSKPKVKNVVESAAPETTEAIVSPQVEKLGAVTDGVGKLQAQLAEAAAESDRIKTRCDNVADLSFETMNKKGAAIYEKASKEADIETQADINKATKVYDETLMEIAQKSEFWDEWEAARNNRTASKADVDAKKAAANATRHAGVEEVRAAFDDKVMTIAASMQRQNKTVGIAQRESASILDAAKQALSNDLAAAKESCEALKRYRVQETKVIGDIKTDMDNDAAKTTKAKADKAAAVAAGIKAAADVKAAAEETAAAKATKATADLEAAGDVAKLAAQNNKKVADAKAAADAAAKIVKDAADAQTAKAAADKAVVDQVAANAAAAKL